MSDDKKMAVIDNDFIEHVASSNLSNDELINTLKTIISELELDVVVHPLVYEHEVRKTTPRVKILFKQNVISEANYSFLGSDSAKKAYYCMLVSELYKSLTEETLSATGEEIFTFWVRLHSLGEIHSVSMCLVCGCGIFLSDDNDSKKLKLLIEKKSLGSIEVYNRAELIDKHLDKGKTNISRAIRRSLAHVRN